MKKIKTMLMVFTILLSTVTPLFSLNDVLADGIDTELFQLQEVETNKKNSRVLEIRLKSLDEVASVKIATTDGQVKGIFKESTLENPIIPQRSEEGHEQIIDFSNEDNLQRLYVECEQVEGQAFTVNITGRLTTNRLVKATYHFETVESEVSKNESESEPEASKDESKAEPEVSKDESESESEVSKDESEAEPEASKDESEAEPEASKDESESEPEASKDELKAEPEVSKDESEAEPEASKDESKAEPEISKDESEAEPEASIVEENLPSVDKTREIVGVTDQRVSSKETHEELGDSINVEKMVAPETNYSLQRDLAIEPVHATVDSGKKALYRFVLKTTGAQVLYKNAVIEFSLPLSSYASFDGSSKALAELEIEGTKPTFNDKTKKLIYQFPELPAGRTYERVIEIETHNGVIPNGTLLKMDGKLTLSGVPEQVASAQVKSQSAVSASISKDFVTAVANGRKTPPIPGSQTEWLIKVAIPKKATGQMYLKPGTDIVVEDQLPAGLTYKGMAGGETAKPSTTKGGKIRWVFKAPSIAEQEKIAKSGNLFQQNLRVLLNVEKDKKWVDKKLTNSATVSGTFIDGTYVSPISKASQSITISDAEPSTGTIKGAILTPDHKGPSNGKNGLSPNDLKDTNPVVYDDASLAFSHGLFTWRYGLKHDLEKLETVYEVDPNLILTSLKTPGGIWYKGSTKEEYNKKIPLTPTPKFDLVLDYEDMTTKKKDTRKISDVKQHTWLTRDELGLKANQRVIKIRYVFKGIIPAHMSSGTRAVYRFDIKEGFTGQAENKFNMVGRSTYDIEAKGYTQGKYHDFNLRKDGPHLYTGKNNISGDRHATVAPRPKGLAPIVEVGVELIENDGNVVSPGQNKMKVTFQTNKTSQVKVTKPVHSLVLLPIGVTVNQSPNASYQGNNNKSVEGSYKLMSSNYNNSGRQLIQVTWPEARMDIGGNFQATLDVTIAEKAPNSLLFDVYGFTGDNALGVPKVTGDVLTNTTLQQDTDDLNKDGKKGTQPRVKSANLYSIVGKYDIQTEKFVKGSGEEWSKMAKTDPGGKVDYKLHMTNTTGKDLSSMTLIDVLPSEGDLGITDNIARGSKFRLKLTGPITLPTEWQNKVSVYYSTSKNPKRDDLIRQTKYPSSTQKLQNPVGAEEPNWKKADDVGYWGAINSFKIELLPNQTWIKGVNMDVLFSMKAPEQYEVSNKKIFNHEIDPLERAAYNSFAVATDKGQPVEPLRVGVYMDYDIKEPTIEKTVNGSKTPLELKNREEEFTWEVVYDFGNYSNGWESVQLSDQLNKVLAITDVKVMDKNNKDVTSKGKLTVDKETNIVQFDLTKKEGHFAYLKDETYTLIIKSRISKDATNEDLLPLIKQGGVPNQAELVINDKPKPSNTVKVVPPEIKGYLEITKVADKPDEEGNSIHLAGAEFEVKTKDGQSVGKLTTDEKGHARLDELDLGEYQLIETKAPSGYKILSKPINFTITAKETHLKLTVKNTQDKTYLPNTGGMGTLVFYVIGGVLMIGSLYTVTTKKKKGVK